MVQFTSFFEEWGQMRFFYIFIFQVKSMMSHNHENIFTVVSAESIHEIACGRVSKEVDQNIAFFLIQCSRNKPVIEYSHLKVLTIIF